LRSMVLMGKGLGLDVVVEGIERETQVEHVFEHCEARVGQGFLFGRPQPLAGFLTLLADDASQRRLPVLPAQARRPLASAG
ncbi:MAG: hypothetical protein M3Q87_02770, partial [Actinomycetota bacterium]|nr:hypothetical protein [Actinomycetota bacterium]